MKASELRIGNYVKDKHGDWDVMKVESILSSTCRIYLHTLDEEYLADFLISDVVPIELTSEWLERFGFVDDSSIGVWFGLKYKGTDIRFTLWDKYGKEPYRFTRTIPDDNIDILYVHQLQNLYHSLTGEELKIIGHLDGASPVLL